MSKSRRNKGNCLKFEGAADGFIHSQQLSIQQRSRIQSAKISKLTRASQTPRNKLTTEDASLKLNSIRNYVGVEKPKVPFVSSEQIKIHCKTDK